MNLGIGVRLMECCRVGCCRVRSLRRRGLAAARLPRFSGDNLLRNQQVVARLKEMAESEGHDAGAVGRGVGAGERRAIVPVMGARTRTQVVKTLARGRCEG